MIARIGLVGAALLAQHAGAQQVIVRNNHELAYRGPVDVRTDTGVIRGHVDLAPHAQGTLRPDGTGSFTVGPAARALELRRANSAVASLALDLVVIPGTSATSADVATSFTPLDLAWTRQRDGAYRASARRNGFEVVATARPDRDGFVDLDAAVARVDGAPASAYVAFVRRVVAPGSNSASLRFNGRTFTQGDSPDIWDRDFWYVRGVDWMQWRSGALSLLAINRFTPVPTIKPDTLWREGSHFYVWERTKQHGDTTWLISEIAGPNAEQAKSRYMPVTPYAPLAARDTVRLQSRLAITDSAPSQWAESQLRVYAGTRSARVAGRETSIDLGVPFTTFGVSYFPYSTFTENLDYYRVPGLTSENFWPIAPAMWKQWKAFTPKMRSDLHIVRSMGFDYVRLHHLELLRTLPQSEAFAFLDFYAGESRALGLHWLVDTEGPAEWVTAVLGRYRDLIQRVELENEVLIGGIKPGDPARWSALYAAAKAAAPNAQVIFTGAGNNAMFERLRTLDVPFDRVGLHAYKHGPQWEEAYSSHVLGSAGYASGLGKGMTIGEFNWKDLTKLSPEARLSEFKLIYEDVLAPRVVSELFQFQLQEQMAFNPAVGGSNSRHYEPLGLDRRPKAEAFETMAFIRKYGRADAPVRVLPVTVGEVQLVNGKATAPFTVINAGGRRLVVSLEPRSFEGASVKLLSASRVTLAPGDSATGRVEIALPAGAKVGTYHHFIVASTGQGLTSIGWGVASNPGAPTFADTSVLGAERVRYAQGLDVVRTLDWSRPIAVVYGSKAAVLELEDAYQLANTLQAATGRPVRISSEKDLPDSLARRGLVFVVGTPASNGMVVASATPVPAGVGSIAVQRTADRELVLLSGTDAKGVEAAVVELELRFWPNAKDASMRIVGMEKGAALGHRTGGSNVDLP